MKDIHVGKINRHLSPRFFCFATRSVGYCQKVLVGVPEMVITQGRA
jgi:hypothetical protein